MTGHEEWEELAAAHALGALEPEDEQRFEAHLPTCPICPQVIADTEAVMADLAATTEQVAPPPELKSRLMAAVREESDNLPRVGVVASPDVLEVRRSRDRSARHVLADNWVRFAAAASVVLLAVIAAGVWSLARTSPSHQPQFVALKSQSQGSPDIATVEVLGDKTWVLPTDLPANNSADSQYVLWAVPSEGAPVAVSGFDVKPGEAAIESGALAQNPTSVKAFAISKEPGRTVPKAPSTVVAQGATPWPVVDAFRTYP